MIEQGFNCVDYTIKYTFDFFETRVNNPDPRDSLLQLQEIQGQVKSRETQ